MTGMPLRTRLFTTVLDRLERRSIVDMDLDDIRRARRSVAPTVPPFSWVTGKVARSVTVCAGTLDARDGARLPVRVYRPSAATGALPTVVFFHGGGWVLGSTRMYDPLCSFLAAEVGAVVLNVDYRMAPEHRAPTAALDCVDAVRQVAADGSRWGSRRVAAGGGR